MNKKDIDYQDDWSAGWNRHRAGSQFKDVERDEKNNSDFYLRDKVEYRITSGMTDGWKARENAVRMLDKNEVKK